MKTAIALAIALALTSIAVMAVQTVMALDVGPGASSFSPGQKHAGVSNPNDPYLGAPGTEFRSVPPNPVIPGASSFSPGLEALAAGGGSGGPG
jgi:hypothetical protein